MLDLETLGTSPGCIVLSIAAVEFTQTELVGSFHTHIDIESCYQAGLTLEPRTVLWWLDQSKDAQNAILQAKTAPLAQALKDFKKRFVWNDLKVWANGASFDFPILKAAHDAVGTVIPWAYYNEMDHRTMKNIIPRSIYKGLQVKPDLAHDALSDAIAQAQTLQNIFHWLKEDGHDVERIAA